MLIPAWNSKHMPNQVWHELAYPFPNFSGANGMDYSSMLGWKLTMLVKETAAISANILIRRFLKYPTEL